MSLEDGDGTVAWGARALELAERLDDVEPSVYALTNIAVAELNAGGPDCRQKLEQSLALALSAGLEEHAGRAYVNLVWWAPRGRGYAAADRYLEAGLEYCSERGLDLWRAYLLAYRARSELDRGRWGDATESAMLVLRDPRTSPVPRIVALAVVGGARQETRTCGRCSTGGARGRDRRASAHRAGGGGQSRPPGSRAGAASTQAAFEPSRRGTPG
jgi:hypothetical protein